MSITIGRNDPCHCGSGKKYKKCHLEKDETKDRKEREKAALNAAKVASQNEDKKEAHAASASGAAPAKHAPPQEGGWMKKMANKVGFFRGPSTQRRTPNKGG